MEHKLLGNKLFLYITEFFAGVSVMAVELGASRLMAPYFSSSQIVWTVIIGVITYFPYEFIRRRSSLFYFVACGLLMITLVSNQAQGVKAWTDLIWGYTIQPSEFVKLACIIVVAKYLESTTDPMGDLKGTARLILLMAIPWGLTLLQGEMGSVLVMIFVFGVMMFFGDPHPHAGGHRGGGRHRSGAAVRLYHGLRRG